MSALLIFLILVGFVVMLGLGLIAGGVLALHNIWEWLHGGGE